MCCNSILNRICQYPGSRELERCVSYIPNNNGLGCPTDACLVINATGYVIIQELEQGLAFLLLKADDAPRDFKEQISLTKSETF